MLGRTLQAKEMVQIRLSVKNIQHTRYDKKRKRLINTWHYDMEKFLKRIYAVYLRRLDNGVGYSRHRTRIHEHIRPERHQKIEKYDILQLRVQIGCKRRDLLAEQTQYKLGKALIAKEVVNHTNNHDRNDIGHIQHNFEKTAQHPFLINVIRERQRTHYAA